MLTQNYLTLIAMSLDHTAGFVKHLARTRDEFLSGKLNIVQPEKGFRAGLDSVLLGASVAQTDGELLDLGCGVGVAALTALTHNEQLNASLIDVNAEMVELARHNIEVNEMPERARAYELDVTTEGKLRSAAGLQVDHFDVVIANPPFFDAAAGTLATGEGRASARHMPAKDLDKWVRTAAASARPGGKIIFVYRADGLKDLLIAFEKRFGAVAALPIVPRHGLDATRILIRGIKGSRAPMSLKSPLILHEDKGREFRTDVDAVFRGSERLHW